MSARDYTIVRKLGQGAFGTCFLVRCSIPDRADLLCVIKQIDVSRLDPGAAAKAINEARILSQLSHPNIVGFHEVYKTRSNKLCIVMELADGGDLKGFIDGRRGKPLLEHDIISIATQVSLALRYLHERNILHRDIKLENIFLTGDNTVKLGDFGASKELLSQADHAKTLIGTPYYFSPELVEDQMYSFPADIWATGVLFYELCTFKPPFDGRNFAQLGKSVISGRVPPLPARYSPDLFELISWMLEKDPHARPTIHQVLRHRSIATHLQSQLGVTLHRGVVPMPSIPPLPEHITSDCEPEDPGERRRLLSEVKHLREELGGLVLPASASNNAREQLATNLEILELKQILLENEGEECKIEVIPPSSPIDESRTDLEVSHEEYVKAEAMRSKLIRELGEETMRELYGIIANLISRPDFTDYGVVSFSSHVKHLLPIHKHPVYIPLVKRLVDIDRGGA